MAEWLKRPTLDQVDGGLLGGQDKKKIFFRLKKFFDLRPISFFTPFFKPYVTFLFIYMAIFPKMAPLFSYEPTVYCELLVNTKINLATPKYHPIGLKIESAV